MALNDFFVVLAFHLKVAIEDNAYSFGILEKRQILINGTLDKNATYMTSMTINTVIYMSIIDISNRQD